MHLMHIWTRNSSLIDETMEWPRFGQGPRDLDSARGVEYRGALRGSGVPGLSYLTFWSIFFRVYSTMEIQLSP